MKTYVLTLSKAFPATHPRHGEPTEFLEKFLNGQTGTGESRKLHTIRANYPLWEKRIRDVKLGKAVLSIRQWSGRPYCSKQVEIAKLTAANVVGIQKLFINNYYGNDRYTVTDDKQVMGYDVALAELAKNDGLSLEDWLAWFKGYPRSQPLAIIHFTFFRY